jgi:hypothetical protein
MAPLAPSKQSIVNRNPKMRFSAVQEFIAEFFGTMVLILFGCGPAALTGLRALLLAKSEVISELGRLLERKRSLLY